MKTLLLIPILFTFGCARLHAFPVVVFNPTNGVVLIPTNFVAANLAGVTVTNTFNGTATNLAGNALVQVTNIASTLSGGGGGGTATNLAGYALVQTTNIFNAQQAQYLGVNWTQFGVGAVGTNGGVAFGGSANGSTAGTAVGMFSDGTSFGVGVGWFASGNNYGVAIGGNDDTGEFIPHATVPDGWTDTVELGRGTAALAGGLNFRGHPLMDGNGLIRLLNDSVIIGQPLYGEYNPGMILFGGVHWSYGSNESKLREDGSIWLNNGAFEVNPAGVMIAGSVPTARLPGITTNLQFKMSGYTTNTLYFTNGVLMRVSTP